MLFLWGLIAGAVAMGFVANRRPSWFANVVKAANLVDAQANAAIKSVQAVDKWAEFKAAVWGLQAQGK